MKTLIWFRRDLRILDNPALAEACRSGQARAIYIDSPDQSRRHRQAPQQRRFIWENLQALAQQLAKRGIPFDLVEAPWFADIPDLLEDYIQQHQIEAVFANRESGVNETRRDAAVQAALPVPCTFYLGQCVLPEGSIKTGQGTMYKVFTPFSRAWLQQDRKSVV